MKSYGKLENPRKSIKIHEFVLRVVAGGGWQGA